jgi:hypothetical protein
MVDAGLPMLYGKAPLLTSIASRTAPAEYLQHHSRSSRLPQTFDEYIREEIFLMIATLFCLSNADMGGPVMLQNTAKIFLWA